MHLYIRADADAKIGTGHIMRCTALAQAWQDHGGEVTFISRCESDALRERIQSEGFRYIAFDKACPDSYDLKNTLAILKSESTDQKHWLVLDGYHFTSEYQKSIRDKGFRLLVIDDMNHLPHYHADILLNQNIHAPNLKYRCDEDTTLLLGTRYVLLRREFLKYRDFKRQIPDRARNILVTLGGADPDNVTLKVIDALKLFEDPKIEVKIVIGPVNSYRDILLQALSSAHFVYDLITSPPNIPELMVWANLAISAGGSTCWELAFMGVPFLTVVLAENQEDIAKELEEAKAALNCGWVHMLSEKQLLNCFEEMMTGRSARASYSAKGRQLVDGLGAGRVIECMERC